MKTIVSLLFTLSILTLSGCNDPSPKNAFITGSKPAFRCQSVVNTEGSHWVSSWYAAPTDALISSPLLNQTIRQFISPHASAEVVRLRLQNRFGSLPATLQSVTLAEKKGAALNAEILPGSGCTLRFNGSPHVTIAPGESVLSDPIYFPVEAFRKVAISFHAPELVAQSSRHLMARDVLWLNMVPGDQTAQESSEGFTHYGLDIANNWLFIEELQVVARPAASTLVTVGDSITDGANTINSSFGLYDGSPAIGEDQRYPDFLARRVLASNMPLSVVNAGISGNHLLGPGLIPQYGPSLISRFDEDVLARPNVSHVLLMIGTNDFGAAIPLLKPSPTVDELISGLKQLIERAHVRGIRVVLGTLPPAEGAVLGPLPGGMGVLHGSPEAKIKRDALNDWIRTSNFHDGFVDFDACLQDPAYPSRLLPAYDSGDHLHPSPLGYNAMADCVDLALFAM